MEKGIKLSRVAHFYGSGLPEPIDVWKGNLDDCAAEVYFTHPYDRSSRWSAALTVAMIETTEDDDEQWGCVYDFESSHEPIPPIYIAMLAHAAMYFMDSENEICAVSEASELEEREGFSQTLRMAGINRTPYLPRPFEEL